MSMEAESGFVRRVARKDTGLILGLQDVGTGFSELAAAFTSPASRRWDIRYTSEINPNATGHSGLKQIAGDENVSFFILNFILRI